MSIFIRVCCLAATFHTLAMANSNPCERNEDFYEKYKKSVLKPLVLRQPDDMQNIHTMLSTEPYYLPQIMNDLGEIEDRESKRDISMDALRLTGAHFIVILSDIQKDQELTSSSTVYEFENTLGTPFFSYTGQPDVDERCEKLFSWYATYEKRINYNYVTEYGHEIPNRVQLTELDFSLKAMRFIRAVEADGICAIPAILNRLSDDNGIMYGILQNILGTQLSSCEGEDTSLRPGMFSYGLRLWEHPETLPDEKWRLDAVVRWWDKHSCNYDTLPVLKTAIEKEMVGIKAKLERLKSEAE